MLWLTLLVALFVPPDSSPKAPTARATPWVLERMTADGRAGVRGDLFDGRPTLVAAFATWCEPCAAEVPMLRRLQREHPELRVVGLSVDDGPPGKVRSWVQTHQVDYPVFLPSANVLAGRSPLGSADDLPVLAFYRPDGTRIRRLVGSVPERLVQRALGELGITRRHTPTASP